MGLGLWGAPSAVPSSTKLNPINGCNWEMLPSQAGSCSVPWGWCCSVGHTSHIFLLAPLGFSRHTMLPAHGGQQ